VAQPDLSRLIAKLGLLILIFLGVALRFAWGNWSQGTNLHPDEYGLTNTLTQLRIPNTASGYFNTRLSPLSPYPRYDEAGQKVADGPDNAMRWGQWPMIIIRYIAELTGNTGYDELRLTGRKLSALADTLSILLIFWIGQRLYNNPTGLLAAALSALAVMQIQQSHFMTMDNFAVLFSMLALYACVRISQRPLLNRPSLEREAVAWIREYRPDMASMAWHLGFGTAFGMALAARINLLPLGGLVLVAGFISIADLRLKSRRDLTAILSTWAMASIIAMMSAGLTFRLAQPMSFRQPSGDTTMATFQLNPDWIENVKLAQMESNGIGGGPPGEQWAHRLPIIFPWINMVLWGMGLPLGITAWTGFAWAAWRTLRHGDGWRSHLLPLIWTGGYFLFMATRWVKSMRYFLPIYPFLALFAAWTLVVLWQMYAEKRENLSAGNSRPWRAAVQIFLPALPMLVVVSGTLLWAMAFVQAIYRVDHTRVQATRWIYEHVPSPFHLGILTVEGDLRYEPVPAPDGLEILPGQRFIQPFTPRLSGHLIEISLPHVTTQAA
jgi:hypothetical protein